MTHIYLFLNLLGNQCFKFCVINYLIFSGICESCYNYLKWRKNLIHFIYLHILCFSKRLLFKNLEACIIFKHWKSPNQNFHFPTVSNRANIFPIFFPINKIPLVQIHSVFVNEIVQLSMLWTSGLSKASGIDKINIAWFIMFTTRLREKSWGECSRL